MTLAKNTYKKLMQFLRQPLSPVLWFLLVVCIPCTATAQTFSASIAGTVKDASGAVVSGAQLKLQNLDTNDVRIQMTGGDGAYMFSSLLPGTYRITATASGFETFVKTGMILRANTAAAIEIPLQVGRSEQQVVVSADTVLMDTESANNSVTMDTALIQSLPNNTLNPLNFVYDLAGTTEAQGGMYSRSNTYDQYGSTFGLNGGRSAESEILVDGAPSTAIDWGGLMVSPIQDSVQEQQVVQNEYDAQYERGGEGVVNLVTKGGSHNFHGEIYDFLNNSSLDANTWSNDNEGEPKGKLHRDQFGANVGGPLWRRHSVYFFGAYEGLRQPQVQSSGLLTVPTQNERAGNFSQTYVSPSYGGGLDVIYNPFSTHQVTDSAGNTYYTRDPFPGNKIPGGMINSVGQKIANLWGLPNRPSQAVNDLNNFAKQGSASTDNDKFDWRIDWNPSTKNHMFIRMDDRVRENDVPPCFFCNGADESAVNNDHGLQVVFNDTWTPNDKWLVNGYGAYTRWFEEQASIGLGVANASTVGLNPGLFQAPLLPLVNAQNYYTLGSTYSSYDRYVRYLSTGIINVTRQMNLHTLKFGFNYDVSMINNIQDSPGNFNFSNSLTSCDPGPLPGDPCEVFPNSNTSGNSIASLLLGAGSGGGSNINMDPAMSLHTFGVYFSDTWRVTPRLTITPGLRYENQRPATERHNRIAYFDPTAINPVSALAGSTYNGEFQYAGVDGRSRYAWNPDNLNFGPRIEVAYRVSDKLVARAGSGIFYGPTSAMISFDSPGEFPGYTSQTNWISTQGDAGYIPSNLVSDPFPQGLEEPTGNTQGGMTLVGNGAGQIWRKGPHPVGVLYQWSMDIQYQVSPHSVAEIGYTGVRGRRLLFGNPNLDLDQMPDKYLSLGPQLNGLVNNPLYGIVTDPNDYLSQQQIVYNILLRPFPEYTYLQQTRSLPGARSQFDALYAKYNHSFSGGISSITSYQWSKNLDDGSEALLGWAIGDMWRDATNPKLDYSISTHDIPQSFAEAGLFQIPYGTNRHWGATAPAYLRQTIGGWNFSPAIRLTSGYPFPNPPEFSYNPVGDYGFPGPGMPDIVGNPKPGNRNRNTWLNLSAFAGASSQNSNGPEITCSASSYCQPFPFRYGNEPQRMTTVREAANKEFDASLSKDFTMERVNLELRGDMLNAFNHPIYGGSYNISDCIDCGDLGTVYGTRNDPRTVQISVKISY